MTHLVIKDLERNEALDKKAMALAIKGGKGRASSIIYPRPGPTFPEPGPTFPGPTFPDPGPTFPRPGPTFPNPGPIF
ncbi:hypothetical protein Nhal_1050 [Nitrosococcus halophilus Nc 4]|uniref:Uncharacterized protein n=1 Tax=Nitrosococcus halophilus (strain Nc4) TaxID=472759 RepID=D5BZ09_NITHN|nr:hypothetical protein Nhal_1050 [Nitrosococcus halophilus Nc 4]